MTPEVDFQTEMKKIKYRDDNSFIILTKQVSIKKQSVKLSNFVLQDIILDRIIEKMKEDALFKKLFAKILFRGSFYKGLKVSKPNEYDLLLWIKLPIKYKYLKLGKFDQINKLILHCYKNNLDNLNFSQVETHNCKPGYVRLRVNKRKRYLNRNKSIWRKILTTNNYLNQDKFRCWIHSVLMKTLNTLMIDDGYEIKSRKKVYTIKFTQSNPAFTLEIRAKNAAKSDMISFDLVPCLRFTDKNLRGFRPSKTKTWTVVAKPMHNEVPSLPETLWRPSFYEDEKRILKGQIKPIIRMAKKFRDIQNWEDVKSYFIETLFLKEMEGPHEKYTDFKSLYEYNSRTCIFIYMLKRLQQVLENGVLLNFWHPQHNMLEKINVNRLQGIANELKRIIKTIDDEIEYDPDVLLTIFKYRDN